MGNNGTTGAITVSVGAHTIGETVMAGTDPKKYTYKFGGACSANGSVNLANGESKICTITNTRKTDPPPPPPPPDPGPDPDPDPDPTPETEQKDFNVDFILPPETPSGGRSILPQEN